MFFFMCLSSYALDESTCADYSAKAKTDIGARIMYSVCIDEKDTSFYNRSKNFKCALKASKALSEMGARVKYNTCIEN